jgi:hypothetical protein
MADAEPILITLCKVPGGFYDLYDFLVSQRREKLRVSCAPYVKKIGKFVAMGGIPHTITP